MIKRYYPFVLLILIHLVLLTQLKYTVWPEMILYPFLMQHGFLLYRDIINPYFPFLPVISFGFFQIFGLTIFNLKLLTWVTILLTDGAVISAAGKFYKHKFSRYITLGIYILLQIYFGGNGLWFELMLTPFILLSLVLVYFNPQNIKKILISALCFSVAVLIKQNALLFLIPIGLFLFFQRKYHSLAVFILTILLILGLSGLLVLKLNLWNDFFVWTIQLPLTFSRQHGFVLLPAFRQYPLILFPLLTLTPFLLNKKIKKTQKIFWGLSFLIAMQFAFPRYENFHLQVLAAFSSLFAPMLPKKYLTIFSGFTVILLSLFFVKNFHQSDRFIDPGMMQLAGKIKNYPSVYILNGSDLSYYFADKIPPKPWAINFPWYFEVNNFENKFIASLKNQKTEYIVVGDPIGGKADDLGNYLPASLVQFIQYNYDKTERWQNYNIWQVKLNSP